jgi:hypothetical protein
LRREEKAMNLKNYLVGVGTLIEWFGIDFETVEPEVAEHRAMICVACPHNQHHKLEERFGEYAHTLMGLKHWLRKKNCNTIHDEELHVCELCNCPMKVKVWTPKELAGKNMDTETKKKLPHYCWIK